MFLLAPTAWARCRLLCLVDSVRLLEGSLPPLSITTTIIFIILIISGPAPGTRWDDDEEDNDVGDDDHLAGRWDEQLERERKSGQTDRGRRQQRRTGKNTQ